MFLVNSIRIMKLRKMEEEGMVDLNTIKMWFG